ncbi:hypothetical protein DYB25_004195 [Aphanomyces astaci]|uniref:FAD-binding FR-type domain-containing protein n=4 Tax=Aphanomyces astaci TaxID=112090 RepID=A0A397A358_APHAT|nr:hypothetical protein DYB36_004472 [Aphanomyces astaci]RHY09526.1 hypothetical protein DYB25_004195 [Aphanomyces astaci]RHY58309.1 hypothetical protein DYB30_004731 [Aphanomyces astaci]RHY77842.1 hypothetical protein DYB34_004121 [Aphanomyces astaci]RHY79618.1 hypothetical protein DYB26_001609 [Aphanomyces astaci]
MLPVAYFFLFFILPVVVAALVFNLTKTVYRGSSFRFLHIEPRWLCCQISYGELAFLGVVLGGNIIVFYQSYLLQIGFDKPTITCIAIALGFSGLYNMVFMALPATRHCFWMEWLNLPWARGVKYHRWLGVLTIVSFVLHFAFFIVQYAITDTLAEELLPCFDCDIATDGKYAWFNVFGELSLLFMLIMGATSFPYVRRHYYATFKATHWLFIPAAFTAVMHYEQIIIWIYVSMVLYIVNRMYSSSTVAYPAALETATALPGQIVQLTFKCSTTYLPADLVYVKVPAISTVQWHPFSIASTPLHTPGLLTIYVKALGHWTSQLHDYVKQCEGEGVQPVVYMDAGYTPPPPMSSSYSSVVFVGGGIGVTPLMAQIMHLLHARPHQDVYLVWHVRTVEMLSQFHGWLRELEDVAEANHGRLHLHLHVTQKGRTDIAVVPAADADRIAPSFDLTRFRAPPRPYAHLSTVRKLGVLLLAFLCSGTLLVYVRFGQKFTKLLGPEYWPLQRFMEFLVVVVGSYCAYGVAVVGHASEPTEGCEIDLRQPQRREVRPGDLLQHFAVKYERANWNQLFHDIQVDKFGFPPNSVGVYVSGPNALAKAIRDVTNHHTLFDVHVEEFEM